MYFLLDSPGSQEGRLGEDHSPLRSQVMKPPPLNPASHVTVAVVSCLYRPSGSTMDGE